MYTAVRVERTEKDGSMELIVADKAVLPVLPESEVDRVGMAVARWQAVQVAMAEEELLAAVGVVEFLGQQVKVEEEV